MLRIIDSNTFSSRIARLSGHQVGCAIAALLVSLSMSGHALATAINYGSFSGTTVDYISVEEISATDPQYFPPNPPVGLFGTPTVSGDSLDFSPNNFFAESQFVQGTDQTDGHLTFGVNAKAGHAITDINFEEGGGLSVVGFGTDLTFVDVSAIGFVNVLEVDGSPVGVIQIPINLAFNFGTDGIDGTWRLASEGFVNAFRWTGAQAIDINQWLTDNTNIDPVYGATKITISLDNSLYAQSEAVGGAYIDKKDFGGLSVTINAPVIPEPATWLLGLMGIAAGAIRRSPR